MTTETRSNLVAITVAVAIVATVLTASFVFADPYAGADSRLGACDGSTDVCGYITDCDTGPDIGTDEHQQAPSTTCAPTSITSSTSSSTTSSTVPAPVELIPPLCVERDAQGAPVEVDCGKPDVRLDDLARPDLELDRRADRAPDMIAFTG
jgi:hypothetical protein